MTIEEQIEEAKENLESLKQIKEHEDNSLLSRVKKIAVESLDFKVEKDELKDLKIVTGNGWFGDCVVIYTRKDNLLFLADFLIQASLCICGIGSSDGNIHITVCEGIATGIYRDGRHQYLKKH